MPEYGLKNYASPYLRKAVFDRLHPGAQVEYEVIPIEAAFPAGHYDGKGEAKEAIVCTITMADGTWVTGTKEVELKEYSKRSNKWVDVEQTAEQFTKDCTKALGRAMRDAGIPMHIDDLKALMQWIVALTNVAGARYVARTDDLVGSDDPDGDDEHPDAGSEPTTEQRVAARLAALDPPNKLEVANRAREELGVTNIMRAGGRAEELETMLDSLGY